MATVKKHEIILENFSSGDSSDDSFRDEKTGIYNIINLINNIILFCYFVIGHMI